MIVSIVATIDLHHYYQLSHLALFVIVVCTMASL